MDEIEQKGLAAAAAYLERVGFVDVEQCGGHLGNQSHGLTAVDGDEMVFIFLQVSRSAGESESSKTAELPNGYDRLDFVDIIVLGPDRALLRHQRGVLGRGGYHRNHE